MVLLASFSDKTETLIIAPECKIPLIKQHIGDLGSSVQPSFRSLSVVFDSAMSLGHHSKQLVTNSFFQLRNISKLRKVVSKGEMEMIILAFIVFYCIIVIVFLPV